VTGEAEPGLFGCVVDDRATLVWVANLASLELHTKQLTVDDPVHPTSMVFDLDPGPPAGVLQCAEVGLELRDVLSELGLDCVVKTSGGKGLHLNVPVAGSTADETKEFARAVGQILERRDPERITTVMRKDLRVGKVFRVSRLRTAVNLDVYNVLNSNSVTLYNHQYGTGSTWLQPQQIVAGRLFKFSAQVDF